MTPIALTIECPSLRLRGEGAERARASEAGEGAFRFTHIVALPPQPTSSLRSKADLSPPAGRGEGIRAL